MSWLSDPLAATEWTGTQERTLLEPYTYIADTGGKEIRSKLIDAFNLWLKVPETDLDVIRRVVRMLHNASLLCVHHVEQVRAFADEWQDGRCGGQFRASEGDTGGSSYLRDTADDQHGQLCVLSGGPGAHQPQWAWWEGNGLCHGQVIQFHLRRRGKTVVR